MYEGLCVIPKTLMSFGEALMVPSFSSFLGSQHFCCESKENRNGFTQVA